MYVKYFTHISNWEPEHHKQKKRHINQAKETWQKKTHIDIQF